MTRGWTKMAVATLLALTGACGAGFAEPAATPVAFSGSKGVNLHNWFTWTPQVSPGQYRLPVFQHMPGELSPADARRLRAAGFDFVRLTVDPGPFVILDGTDRAQAVAALESAIDRLRAAGLSVIVDQHAVKKFQPDPSTGIGGTKAWQGSTGDPMVKRFQVSSASLAGALDKKYGGTRGVAFELLNEPELPCGSVGWRAEQAALHRAVRAAAPRLTLVLTGACWGGIGGLTALNPADYADANALYTFHFYDDGSFTHQGVDFSGGEFKGLSGIPYPWNARDRASIEADLAVQMQMTPHADAAFRALTRKKIDNYFNRRFDRGEIEKLMDRVVTWASTNHIPANRVLMGEFGVNRRRGTVMGARDEDRLRWLADVRQVAEARGFRWAMWLYRGNNKGGDDFDLVLEDGSTPDPATVRALGLGARR